MSLRTSLQNLIRRDPAASLRERAADLRASIPAPERPRAEPATSGPAASATRPTAAPDPALAIVTVFRASWDALGKVLDAEAPDEMVAELEDAQAAAYERLRSARPTTPEGYRALAECWAMVLRAHRGDETGMTVDDHAADALIAGAGACVPIQPVDWHSPPPGFMASPAIEPTNFAQISQGLRIELERLHGIALAEFQRRFDSAREGQDDRLEREAAIRAELFLAPLTAAIDPKSSGALALAALDRPAALSRVLALIEEHRAAYAEWDRLSDVWNEMLENDPGYAEAVAASDEPGRREVAAYNALFMARPTTLPGAIVLTEYLREATERASADTHPSDAERALSVVANALREIAARADLWPAPNLVGMLDLAAASLADLQALHDLADLVGGVAYATCWQSRAQDNAAGMLMQWLGDALIDVASAANNEARHRKPGGSADRETRLEMLALPVIQNGDPDEIEDFARRLLAYAEAERAER